MTTDPTMDAPTLPAKARRCLLVSGSRALDPRYRAAPGTLRSREWAHAALHAALEAVGAGGFVVTGRCDLGPDAWAEELARRLDLTVVGYAANGVRWVDGAERGRWATEEAVRSAWSWAPLMRNDAMVAAMKKAVADGHDGRVLALVATWPAVDPPVPLWERRGGTMYTARAAKVAGLRVDVAECPIELSRP